MPPTDQSELLQVFRSLIWKAQDRTQHSVFRQTYRLKDKSLARSLKNGVSRPTYSFKDNRRFC